MTLDEHKQALARKLEESGAFPKPQGQGFAGINISAILAGILVDAFKQILDDLLDQRQRQRGDRP